MELSVVVPTFNEGPNVGELLRRLGVALDGVDFEVIFADDSRDDTPVVIAYEAASTPFPVQLLHRAEPTGGLGGAVVEGITRARSDLCLVMDGDLQHPPEVIPSLLARFADGDADIVLASRYAGQGTHRGLATGMRVLVSRVSTVVTKAMFPRKLHGCSDPMTGFFLVDRRTVDFTHLAPRGFKILLEILARKQHRIAELPFDFAPRYAGKSKASLMQGLRFVVQLSLLRFGRMSAFAIVGGLGAVLNILIVAGLIALDTNYLVAALIASEVTIVSNFLALDYVVFADMRRDAEPMRVRFLKSFAFNNIEALLRTPVLWWLVTEVHVSSVIAAALTIVIAFLARFVFYALVVYAPAADASVRSRRAPRQLS